MNSFSAIIKIIGVNPYVLLPAAVLKDLFKQADKNKGPIPVKGKLNNKPFIQTLVKYQGKWRLYLNGPMREAAGIDVGDEAFVKIAYDPKPRILTMHPDLKKALAKDPVTKKHFEALSPYRQKEIIRYIGFLKTKESLDKNIAKVLLHLQGKERFAGHD